MSSKSVSARRIALAGITVVGAAGLLAGSAQGYSPHDHAPGGAIISQSPESKALEAARAARAARFARSGAEGDQSLALVPASVDGEAPPTAGLAESLGGLTAWLGDHSAGRFRLAGRITPQVGLSGNVCWNLWPMARDVRALTSIPENHVGIVTPGRGCGYAGLGGGGALHMNGYTSSHLLRHEYGHILGLGHANTGTCSNLADMSSCDVTEYGDRLDVMGSDREIDGLTAGMRHVLGWGEEVNPGTGGEFRPAARGFLKVTTARSTYFVEWLDRQMTTDKWICSRTCVREVVTGKGMGVQAIDPKSRYLVDTIRPMPEPGRYVWNAGEEFHAPGIFRVSGRDGVMSFRWDDTTPPALSGPGRVEDWGDGTWQASVDATDDGSGVDRLEASSAEGQPAWSGSYDDGGFSVPNAVRAISVTAVDRAGNRSAHALIKAPRMGPQMTVRVGSAKCTTSCRPKAKRNGRYLVTVGFRGAAPTAGTIVRVRVQGAMRRWAIARITPGKPLRVRVSGLTRPRMMLVRVGASAEMTSGGRAIKVIPRRR